jgi:hypothetical protein
VSGGTRSARERAHKRTRNIHDPLEAGAVPGGARYRAPRVYALFRARAAPMLGSLPSRRAQRPRQSRQRRQRWRPCWYSRGSDSREYRSRHRRRAMAVPRRHAFDYANLLEERKRLQQLRPADMDLLQRAAQPGPAGSGGGREASEARSQQVSARGAGATVADAERACCVAWQRSIGCG